MNNYFRCRIHFKKYIYIKLNVNFVFITFLFLNSLFFFVLFVYIIWFSKSYFFDYEVFSLNGVRVRFRIYLDWISRSFISFVLLISFVVVMYRLSYIRGDKYNSIFILLVFFFVMSIIFLIISPNLIRILLGWDGLGLISYCLVIYYQNIKSYNAGMVTAITNRIGDVIILLGIGWIINFGRWNFLFYFDYEKKEYLTIGSFLIFAAITKSAQIPFSSWLPAAMAAPTPVSALVHSSTLVTAGVYLLIRFDCIFMNENIKHFILVVSVLTIFMSGLSAIFEYDLKKIIALSTLRQLGLIIRTLRLGLTGFCFFHLLRHALFKSLLFMCAGYIIHGIRDCQDIRFIGSIAFQSPLLNISFNMANLSLCGIPFLAGFYSKDLILENVLIYDINILILFLFFLRTGLTVVYTFRLIFFRMVDCYKIMPCHSFNDNDYIILTSISFILGLVILGGAIFIWIIFIDFEGIILSYELKLFTLFLCLVRGGLGYLLGCSETFSLTTGQSYMSNNFIGEIWFLPYLSTYIIVNIPLTLGYLYVKIHDLGWGEKLGGQGVYSRLVKLNKHRSLIEGEFNFYLVMFLYFIFWLIIFLNFYLNSLYKEHDIEAVKEFENFK